MPFTSTPTQSFVPQPYPFSKADQKEVRLAIQEALEQNIVVPVEVLPGQFVSPLFLAKNKDGTKRPILNVKDINENFLPKLHFKMETLKAVLPLINKGDYFCSWDLRKGFFNVAIHPDFQKFFCFEFEGQRYKFTCLVMGLSIAPLYFSKIMGLLVQLARSWGIRVSFYIDDTLIRGPNFQTTRNDTFIFGNILQLAGFLLHERKSVFEPTQEITYLGFVLNSRTMTIALPEDKVKRLSSAVDKAIKDLKKGRVITIRLAARITGFIVSTEMATDYGKAHFRALEKAKTEALSKNYFNFEAPFVWPQYCLQDLEWWSQQSQHKISATFEARKPTTTIITDASLEGWGAIWGDKQVYGLWEKGEEGRIDNLELRTVLIALQTWPVAQRHKNILLRCDNTTAVIYVNRMGGRVDHLNEIAKEIWKILEQNSSFMTAAYINTKENPADTLTRGVVKNRQMLDIEVQLNPRVFEEIRKAGPFQPLVDWFASDTNHQLEHFFAWKYVANSAAKGIDAFTFCWSAKPAYMFPPFSLIPRILRKVVDDKARILLVHPDWPGSLWYPTLNQITRTRRELPQSADLLRYPELPDLRHPMKNLRLVASWIDGAFMTKTYGER